MWNRQKHSIMISDKNTDSITDNINEWLID